VQLRQTLEFKEWNGTGHGMYAAALNNYQKYLLALASHTDAEPNEYGPH
jgi:hypothetical protein